MRRGTSRELAESGAALVPGARCSTGTFQENYDMSAAAANIER